MPICNRSKWRFVVKRFMKRRFMNRSLFWLWLADSIVPHERESHRDSTEGRKRGRGRERGRYPWARGDDREINACPVRWIATPSFAMLRVVWVDVFSDVLSDVRVARVREVERQRGSRRDAAEVSGYAVGAIFFQYQLREKSVAYGDGAEHLAGTAFRTAAVPRDVRVGRRWVIGRVKRRTANAIRGRVVVAVSAPLPSLVTKNNIITARQRGGEVRSPVRNGVARRCSRGLVNLTRVRNRALCLSLSRSR